MLARMIGKSGHASHCDCNIEQYVSGRSEKCNYRYGTKRARARERREWKRVENEPNA